MGQTPWLGGLVRLECAPTQEQAVTSTLGGQSRDGNLHSGLTFLTLREIGSAMEITLIFPILTAQVSSSLSKLPLPKMQRLP